MANILSTVFIGIGLACLIYGYVKKNRNYMLAGGLFLLVGGELGDFIHGYLFARNSLR